MNKIIEFDPLKMNAKYSAGVDFLDTMYHADELDDLEVLENHYGEYFLINSYGVPTEHEVEFTNKSYLIEFDGELFVNQDINLAIEPDEKLQFSVDRLLYKVLRKLRMTEMFRIVSTFDYEVYTRRLKIGFKNRCSGEIILESQNEIDLTIEVLDFVNKYRNKVEFAEKIMICMRHFYRMNYKIDRYIYDVRLDHIKVFFTDGSEIKIGLNAEVNRPIEQLHEKIENELNTKMFVDNLL